MSSPYYKLFLSGAALLAAFAASAVVHAEATGPLQAVKDPNPAACVVNEQTGTPCPNWNTIPEKPEPDACIYEVKQTGKKCMRWYSVYSVTRPPQEVVLRTNKIHFEFNKARILPVSYPVLNEIAGVAGRPEVRSIVVEGHTDSIGSDAYNLRLSDKRAESVRAYLADHGLADSAMTAVGKGESEPVADNTINGRDNPAGRDLNRRVEFHLQLAPGANAKVVQGSSGPVFPDKNRDFRSASN